MFGFWIVFRFSFASASITHIRLYICVHLPGFLPVYSIPALFLELRTVTSRTSSHSLHIFFSCLRRAYIQAISTTDCLGCESSKLMQADISSAMKHLDMSQSVTLSSSTSTARSCSNVPRFEGRDPHRIATDQRGAGRTRSLSWSTLAVSPDPLPSLGLSASRLRASPLRARIRVIVGPGCGGMRARYARRSWPWLSGAYL